MDIKIGDKVIVDKVMEKRQQIYEGQIGILQSIKDFPKYGMTEYIVVINNVNVFAREVKKI